MQGEEQSGRQCSSAISGQQERQPEQQAAVETVDEDVDQVIAGDVEAATHLHRTIQAIRAAGARPGVTRTPATPLSSLEAILPDIDLALIMSVNPGFGGQSYIEASTDKIRHLRGMLDAIGSSAHLEVDGGVKSTNVAEVTGAGADVIVAGSAVFGGNGSVADNVAAITNAW